MPAPQGNQNAVRHGLHAGQLPKSCRYITNAVNALRRQLESETLSRHGSVNVYRAALIQSCVRHETRAKLLQRWLRLNETPASNGKSGDSDGKALAVLEKAQLLKQISDATDARDRCLERLGLDQDDQGNLFDSLRLPTQQPDTTPAPAAEPPAQGPSAVADDSTAAEAGLASSAGHVGPQDEHEMEEPTA